MVIGRQIPHVHLSLSRRNQSRNGHVTLSRFDTRLEVNVRPEKKSERLQSPTGMATEAILRLPNTLSNFPRKCPQGVRKSQHRKIKTGNSRKTRKVRTGTSAESCRPSPRERGSLCHWTYPISRAVCTNGEPVNWLRGSEWHRSACRE